LISCNLSSNIQHKPESGLRKFDILYLKKLYIRCVNKTLATNLKTNKQTKYGNMEIIQNFRHYN